MADYTITGTAVLQTTGTPGGGVAGVAIAAGDMLYLDSAAGTLKLAQSDGTSAESKCVGMALNNAAIDQPVAYAGNGEVTVQGGAFATVGLILLLSNTAGRLAPVADVGAADYLTIIGWSSATNKFKFGIVNTLTALT